MNRTSMQRGMVVSTTLKKYSDTITKNTATGQDDVFMKPDRNKVTGMMDSNYYNKLNDKGYVPEETVITNGDVIIGKVSPIQAGTSTNKLYKDESEPYKSTVPGTVDKVYTGIYNSDGYEMYNMKIRSERNPTIGDKMCVLGTHEVLTSDGWMRFDELYKNYNTNQEFKKNLKVAQLNDGVLEYVKPIDVFEFDYNDKMYKLESQFVDFQVTKDHMLYIKKRDKKEFELTDATNVYGKRVNFKKDCIFNGYKSDTISLTLDNVTKTYNMNAYLKLLGMFISDGYMKNSQAVMGFNKERKMEFLKNSIEGYIDYQMNTMKNNRESKYKNLYLYKITDKIINHHLSKLNVGAINKFLPDFVFTLDQSHAEVLLDALINGDGHTFKLTGSTCYYTSSKRLADDVQRLTIHAGKSGMIKTIRDIYTPNTKYKLNADCLCVRINSNKNEPQINHGHVHKQNGQSEEWVDYNGKVYCLQVPSSVFMIKYNEKNHWTGNCSRH